jgi:uncharacterized protein
VAIRHRIKLALAAGAGFALLVAAPASAQHYSDGYKFLDAVDKGELDKVKELVNKNSTVVDSRDVSDGHTALLTTVKRRDGPWLRYLLTLGANPNLADKRGVTPLMLASQLGFTEGIEMLAQRGAKVDEANDAGETPLILAVHRRDVPMLRILLAAGADPDHSDNAGRTARDYAKIENVPQALDEFAKNDKKGKRKTGQTYGPTF